MNKIVFVIGISFFGISQLLPYLTLTKKTGLCMENYPPISSLFIH